MEKEPKEEIRARLVVHGIAEMDKTELAFFKKWLKMVAKELTETKDLKIFSKRLRQTLYKAR